MFRAFAQSIFNDGVRIVENKLSNEANVKKTRRAFAQSIFNDGEAHNFLRTASFKLRKDCRK